MMPQKKDLIVLTADTDAKSALDTLLTRHQALNIRPISFEVIKHHNRDNGCRVDAHNLLRALPQKYEYALVIFDLAGSGGEKQGREQLEKTVLEQLQKTGWDNRAEVIALVPELEIWVWSDSSKVDEILGWSNRTPSLREWLKERKWLRENEIKPQEPKEAMEKALLQVNEPRSASLFGQLAKQVSFRTCTDPSFQKLLTTLQTWFPIVESGQ